MRATLILLLALLLGACSRGPLAARAVQPKSAAAMTVASDSFAPGGAIAARYAGPQALSPPLHWSAVPGAQAYAIVMQDSDSPTPKPFVHWTIWNIPAEATALAEGVAPQPLLVIPDGARQGANDAGGIGYFGPAPPSGVHHYHLQLFALDQPLNVAPGAKLDALLAAMKGHVLAAGELAGTFAAH